MRKDIYFLKLSLI